ncbi:MAG TPA: MFS transporter [archaeon]|nr:MFS transporter [archaeon]
MNEKKAFIALSVLTFSTLVTDRILFVLFPNYLIDRRFSPLEIGLIFSTATLILLMFKTSIGKISDMMGRKTIMSLGLGIQSISITLYTVISSIAGFSMIRGLQSIGETLVDSVEDAFTGDLFSKKNRPKVVSRLGAVYAFARVVAVVIGFIAITYFSINYGFYVAAVASVFSAIAFYFLIKQSKKTPRRHSLKIVLKPNFKKYSRAFYKLSFSGFLQELAFGIGISPTFFILARKLGMSASNIFLALLFSYVVNSVIIYLLNKKKGNLATKHTYFYGLLIYSAGVAMYSLATSSFQIFLLLPISTFGFYIFRIGHVVLLLDTIKPKMRGEQIGFSRTAAGVGQVIGPAIGGIVAQFVSLSLAFILAATSTFLASIVVKSIKKAEERITGF